MHRCSNLERKIFDDSPLTELLGDGGSFVFSFEEVAPVFLGFFPGPPGGKLL
jgi:hypothetical protein